MLWGLGAEILVPCTSLTLSSGTTTQSLPAFQEVKDQSWTPQQPHLTLWALPGLRAPGVRSLTHACPNSQGKIPAETCPGTPTPRILGKTIPGAEAAGIQWEFSPCGTTESQRAVMKLKQERTPPPTDRGCGEVWGIYFWSREELGEWGKELSSGHSCA